MSSGDERPGGPRPATGTVAWIDLRYPRRSVAGDDRGAVLLDRISRAVRGDDRVCPLSTSSAVVQFGVVATAVPLDVLGDRLALALATDPGMTGAHVAVGMAAPDGVADDVSVAGRARSAARSALRSERPPVGADRGTTTSVVVDGPTASAVSAGAHTGVHRALRRRTTHRSGSHPSGVVHDRGFDGRCPADGGLPGSGRCVLVLDPLGDGPLPAFASLATAAEAERLGCRTLVGAVSAEDPPTVSVDGVDIDLVLLVLGGGPIPSTEWARGAWGLPARVVTGYVDKGVPVLAIGAGAGAGALAACVACGALPVHQLGQLGPALRALDGLSIDEARTVAELGYPTPFRSLVGLTVGERRVLFYLTEGWAAQDIADALVVSLTTVRSHIRSVLRKLEVRSQLAAVAIANSRDLEQVTPPVPGG